jgi:hypothetical protein
MDAVPVSVARENSEKNLEEKPPSDGASVNPITNCITPLAPLHLGIKEERKPAATTNGGNDIVLPSLKNEQQSKARPPTQYSKSSIKIEALQGQGGVKVEPLEQSTIKNETSPVTGPIGVKVESTVPVQRPPANSAQAVGMTPPSLLSTGQSLGSSCSPPPQHTPTHTPYSSPLG